MSTEEKDFLQEGMNSLKMGDLERAEEIFKDFLQQFPNSDLADNACYQLAQINLKKGQKMNALAWFDYLLKHYPDSDAAYFAKDEREELQRELDAMIPGSPEEAYSRAKNAFTQGNLSQAEQLFQEFLKQHSSNALVAEAHYYLIAIYTKQQRAEEVRQHFEILKRDFPYSDAKIMAEFLVREKKESN